MTGTTSPPLRGGGAPSAAPCRLTGCCGHPAPVRSALLAGRRWPERLGPPIAVLPLRAGLPLRRGSRSPGRSPRRPGEGVATRRSSVLGRAAGHPRSPRGPGGGEGGGILGASPRWFAALRCCRCLVPVGSAGGERSLQRPCAALQGKYRPLLLRGQTARSKAPALGQGHCSGGGGACPRTQVSEDRSPPCSPGAAGVRGVLRPGWLFSAAAAWDRALGSCRVW